MTIHKAKGLEFDLVVVPALNRHARQNGSQLLLAHQFARTERDGMVMAARPPVGAKANRLFEFLRAEATDAAALESQRLLYVACTRAKSELHLYAEIGLREDPDAAPGETVDEPPGVRPPHSGVCWRSCGRPSPTSSPSLPKARLRAAGRRPPCAADRCAECPPVGRRMKCLPRRREPRRCLRSMTRARKPRYSIGWRDRPARGQLGACRASGHESRDPG